jgi:hypothetical protein
MRPSEEKADQRLGKQKKSHLPYKVFTQMFGEH